MAAPGRVKFWGVLPGALEPGSPRSPKSPYAPQRDAEEDEDPVRKRRSPRARRQIPRRGSRAKTDSSALRLGAQDRPGWPGQDPTMARLHRLGMDEAPVTDLQVQCAQRPLRRQSSAEFKPELLPADETTCFGRIRRFAGRALLHPHFDLLIGLVIVLNSLTIGLEIAQDLEGNDLTVFKHAEAFFLLVYVIELQFRFFAHGWHCLKNHWVLFDFVLVCTGLTAALSASLLPLLGEKEEVTFGPLMVLRVFRLLRLARAVRLVVRFKTLWMLVRGLLGSAGTMVYTFALLSTMIYIFACIGVELITKQDRWREDPAFDQLVVDYFSSIPITMLTLIQFTTLDSIGPIYHPMISRHPALAFYFVTFLLMVSISLMNLVTAVLVNGAIEQAQHDKESAKAYRVTLLEELRPRFEQMFRATDADGDGMLTLPELIDAPEEVREELCRLMGVEHDDEAVQEQRIVEIFECIDVDDSGEISLDEFLDGVSRLRLSETSVETLRILRQLQLIRVELRSAAPRDDGSRFQGPSPGADLRTGFQANPLGASAGTATPRACGIPSAGSDGAGSLVQIPSADLRPDGSGRSPGARAGTGGASPQAGGELASALQALERRLDHEAGERAALERKLDLVLAALQAKDA